MTQAYEEVYPLTNIISVQTNQMESPDTKDKLTYEQFQEEWLKEIEADGPAPLEKGKRFATKLVSQWLDVTTDDDDFVICEGKGDGGIDIAYLQRADSSDDEQGKDPDTIEGDTWYLVQSKYGSAFTGSDTILKEGNKVLTTLQGHSKGLSSDSRQLLKKLTQFWQQASDADRIVLVFATTDPITQQDRQVLEKIKILGREQIMKGFDVEDISLRTIWETQDKLSVPLNGQFVEMSSDLMVGTVSLLQLFSFLESYRRKTGNLDQIYDKNVRQFLGNRRQINKGIAKTLTEKPENFGLYNNGITIVVSDYEKKPGDSTGYSMDDPFIVNGCQTTRTIWEVLDSRLNAGGTGTDIDVESWKEELKRGGVVTKISKNEKELPNITRFTNKQNSVREQDFIALNRGFQDWASEMEEAYNIFLEIQRGGIDSRKAWEKQHPEAGSFDAYVNAFDLIKVYGAGWLGVPGTAFSKNAQFLPGGDVYKDMVSRKSTEPAFGARDLYAAYMIQCAADKIGFGRKAKNQLSRRQSRFLFYHVIMSMLHDTILLTPELQQPSESSVPTSALTDAVIKLNNNPESKVQFESLSNSAVQLIDRYLTLNADDNLAVDKEVSYNGDLNRFLKSNDLGKKNHSPLLVESIRIQKVAFGMTHKDSVAQALLDQ